jgi:hypothetical protein
LFATTIFLFSLHFCIACSFVADLFFIFYITPASANLRVINLKLDILCYSSIDLPVAAAVSELVIPGLCDQLSVMKKAIVSELLTQQPQVFDLLVLQLP